LGGSLDPAITFSRGTQATQYTSNGTLQYAPNNLLTYSNAPDNAAWTKSNSFVQTNLLLQSQTLGTTWIVNNVSVNSNVAVAPDGTLTADEIVCTANALAYLTQNLGAFSTYSSTLSVYLKVSGTDRGAILNFQDDTGGVDIYSLTIPSLASGGTDAGNGWRRYSVTGLTPTPGNVASVRIYVDKNGTGVSGVSRLYAWGAQLVQGSVPGDYVATTSAALPVLYPSYNGVVRARKLCEDATATTTHRILNNAAVTVDANGVYTYSWYVKAGEVTEARLTDNAVLGATFNLATGASSSVSAGYTASSVSIGNGWWRLVISGASATASGRILIYLVKGGTSTYTGDGSSGIYIADAQLEAGSTVQAYNDTTSAAYYGPRFDYDPTNYVRQNLLTYSEQLNNAAWLSLGTAGGSISPNVAVAPDGTSTADKVVVGTGSGAWYVANYANQNIVSGQAYTFSVYVKAAELGYVFVRPHNNSVNFGASGFIVNLSDGSITYPSVPTAPASTGTVTSAGNGWWRISATSTANLTVTPTTGGPGIWPASSAAFSSAGGVAPISFTGNGTDGVYAWGAQLNVGSTALTYTATTTAPYTLVAARGLLIEEQRANLLTYSQDLSNAAWFSTAGTVSANQPSAPDLTSTANLYTASAGLAFHYVNRSAATSVTGTYTSSFYVKKGTSSWIFIDVVDSSLNYFNFDTGTFGTTPDSCTATNVGNGWWRLTCTKTVTALNAACGVGVAGSNGGANFTATGTESVYVWGAQLEAGAFATSYIPTVGSQVTRAADSASITTLTPWFNAAAGTLFGSGTRYNVAANAGSLFEIGDGTNNNRLLIFGNSPTPNGSFFVANGGVTQAFIEVANGFTVSTAGKIAAAYALNDFQQASNSVLGTADTSGTLPTVTTAYIGKAGSGATTQWNGWIANIAYYPTRLPNATLQGLTV
jgi:hypothetical protein